MDSSDESIISYMSGVDDSSCIENQDFSYIDISDESLRNYHLKFKNDDSVSCYANSIAQAILSLNITCLSKAIREDPNPIKSFKQTFKFFIRHQLARSAEIHSTCNK